MPYRFVAFERSAPMGLHIKYSNTAPTGDTARYRLWSVALVR